MIWKNPRWTRQAELQGFTVNRLKYSQPSRDPTSGCSQWICKLASSDDSLQTTDPGVRFFHNPTVGFQTIYALFFIELGSRRIHFAGVTTHPNEIWITQQARQLIWELEDRESSLQFLIHDNDPLFSQAFDAVFESEGFHIIHTPFQAPNANSHAERWVRTVREECLDHSHYQCCSLGACLA